MSSMNQDPRLPLTFGPAAPCGPETALLVQAGAEAPPDGAAIRRFALPPPTAHPVGCACCAPRGPVAAALAALWLARARGEAPFFTRVVAVTCDAAGRAAVREALARDPLVRARFRPG